MDADMLAKAPLDDLVDGSPAVFPLEWWKSDEAFAERHEGAAPRDGLEHFQVGNYAFGAVAGHPLVLDALDEATERSRSLVAGRAGLRGLARRLFAAEGAAITDLEVLRTTGPYMLSEVYHDGRLSASPKYGDVELLRGDDAAPAAARSGANDWHKFGRFAEHTLAHTWVSRKLQDDYGDYCDCGNTDPLCCSFSVMGECVDHCGGESDCDCGNEDPNCCVFDWVTSTCYDTCTGSGGGGGGGGGYDYGDCEDTNGSGRDNYGDSCEWYNENAQCGGYDDDDFYAHEMCCSCGGGSTGGSGDDSADEYCEGDDADWVSKKGEDCDWVYKKNEDKDWDKKKAKKNCKLKGEDGEKAKKACKECACDKKSFRDDDDTGEASVEIIVPVVVVAVFLMAAAGWLVKRRTVKKKQHRRQSMPSALQPSSSRTIGAEQ